MFHSSESNADDYIEMPGEVWGTVKTGLLNEAFDRYCNIVLQRLGGDELVKDDDYMKNLGQESFKAARRASMNDFTTDAKVVPHFLNVLKTTYEQNLSAQLHQDSLFIKLRRRLWILLSEPDSSMAAMIVSIFVLLTIFLSSTIFCMETMEEDSGNRGTNGQSLQLQYTLRSTTYGALSCAPLLARKSRGVYASLGPNSDSRQRVINRPNMSLSSRPEPRTTQGIQKSKCTIRSSTSASRYSRRSTWASA